jgi:hypothetical protein
MDDLEKTIEEKYEGAFVSSLKRNNAKIRADRAQAIEEDAQVKYQRMVQDIELKIKQLKNIINQFQFLIINSIIHFFK